MSTRAFHKICALEDIPQNTGVCALVDGQQIAIFRTGPKDLHAVSNHDPFSKANVLSRGIVGTKGDTPKVASPIYKQQFDLTTGQCLDDPEVRIPTFAVREQDGAVFVCSQEGQ
ncbi:MAG: nitrite reductase (NAD(P)H) small subunit [Verrucomicrobiales bacterium]|nr:nitrite reductase (NAD(P)H) small subunit [Verrucomicrobiales bacterium]MBL68250.1 nitrite reductase (NAD(P)H) small subunit [Verrucomicrobiales bacterium]|tara:strand:+ start:756 stop:1097 length:342 start_codon:yes stop_codon:yes gene_type:complete